MKLQLFGGPTSPYVRKVRVAAHELGLADSIEPLESAANPIARDGRIAAFNPLGKVPAARTEGGMALYDSRVICEYLDSLAGDVLFPAPGPDRWAALRRQALADGLLDAALLMRYERTARPEERQWDIWVEKQGEKVLAALDAMEADIATAGDPPVDIGTITFGCALGWLDFRMPDLGWRTGRDMLSKWYAGFEQRASMQASKPWIPPVA